MTKTQRKDAFRNIWKQKVSYLSIIVIAFLGVTTFLGIDYTDGALRKNGSDMYNSVNFRDIELFSTALLTQEDLEAIRETEGVADTEAVWQTDGKVTSQELRQNVNVISLTERINLPQLRAGRLPESVGECAVENRLAEAMGWQTGDMISVSDASGHKAEYLKEDHFLITGIADHPDHTSTSIPDTLYVLVLKDAFDMDSLDNCCMKAEVVIQKSGDMDRFSKKYDAAVAPVLARLEETAALCSLRRDGELPLQLRSRIEEGQRDLDEGAQALRDARDGLDEGWQAYWDALQELENGRKKLSEAKKQLEDSWAQLEDGRIKLNSLERELNAAWGKLEDGKAQLNAAEATLAEGRGELERGWDELEKAKAEFRNSVREAVETILGGSSSPLVSWAGIEACQADSEDSTAMNLYIANGQKIDLNLTLGENLAHSLSVIPDSLLMKAYRLWCEYKNYEETETEPAAVRQMVGEAASARMGEFGESYAALREFCQQWDGGHQEYLNGLSAYQKGLAEYNEALEKYYEGRSQYNVGYDIYSKGLVKYQEGKAQYEQGLRDLEDAEKELAELLRKLQSGEQEYAQGLSDYQDGDLRLQEARERLEELAPSRWVIMDCKGNSSFVQLLLGSSNLSSLEMTFSMLFVLLGALVIFATVSKMIDEQRSLVGAGKALGLYNREIFAKYLSYGVSGTLLGTVLGILAARFGMEAYILTTSAPYYTFDTTKPAIFPRPTLIALGSGLLLAVAATWFACNRLLRSTAVQLMQPSVPQGRKKAKTGSKHVLSLYSRLILLNIRTDFRRVLVTVVSVAGCCALVVIGFTLKSAVEGALEKQYTKIVDYDGRILYDTQTGENAAQEIEQALRQSGAEYTALLDSVVSFQVTENLVGELLCGDIGQISSFYHLRDWKTDEPLLPTDDGILIQKRTAESCGLDLGSELTLHLGNNQSVTVRVAGIFDNYIGRFMLISPACYRALTGEDCQNNSFYIRLHGADEPALLERLRTIQGFESYSPSDADKSLFASSSVLVTVVVGLFIFMAAVMAGVVLTNLTNIFIMQKKRELTIMRINGFTVGEVVGYVVREIVVTTLLGIGLGLVMGSGIAYKIIRAMESSFIQYDRSLSPLSWLYAAGITGLFALLINGIILRKIRCLKLSDMT